MPFSFTSGARAGIAHDDACRDCGRPLEGSTQMGKWGSACADCADAHWASRNRYLQPFAQWLHSQRHRADEVGRFARFCEAARLKPDGSTVSSLVLDLVRAEADRETQDAALKAWQREGWTVPPR
jgi:hypothetical protein